jgi:CRP-like cAMP-binding protein
MTARLEFNRNSDTTVRRHNLFFSSLSPEETQILDKIIIKRQFRKDQVILSEEDTSLYMYLVYSGKVRVVKISDDGREQIISFHRKGEYFGEMSLLDGKTSPATVISHEDAVVGLLHKTDFEYYMLNHEGIRRKIIDLLCTRLREAWKMVKVLSFESAESRIMAALDHLQQIYGVKDDRGTIINLKLTHQMIASYASVARETATRVLNKLEQSGAIAPLANKSYLLKETFQEKLKKIQM